jgi:hypothetical protein
MSLLTWHDHSNHQASNPTNWSPNGPPQPGDTLLMTGGTMHIGSKALAGDTLNVNLLGPNPYQGGSADLYLSKTAVVPLTALVAGGTLHTLGGTLQFIDNSSFNAYSTVLNSNLR